MGVRGDREKDTHPNERELRHAEDGLAGGEARGHLHGEVLVRVPAAGAELGVVAAHVEDVAERLGDVDVRAAVGVARARLEGDGDADLGRARQGVL